MKKKLNCHGSKQIVKTQQELEQCIVSRIATGTETNQKVVVHKNEWHWGTSYVTVTTDGCGVHIMGVEKQKPDECFFGTILVHESKRNKGIGKMLHMIGEDRAKELGIHSIELVTDENSWMKLWYERMGYKVIKINDDHTVTMKKTL